MKSRSEDGLTIQAPNATLRVNIPCATPADLATMSGSDGRAEGSHQAARPEDGDRDLDG